MEIREKRMIITGAASGIGAALLTELVKTPCQIITVDRNEAGLNSLTEKLKKEPAELFPYVCDLSDPLAVDDLFNFALDRMGGVDLFFANAGFAYYEVLNRPDWQHIEKIFKVNLFSPIYSAQKMKEINPGRTYRVVVTASGMSKFGLPGYALYTATKAALDQFADTYRFELEDPKSLVLVYPIATRTNFFAGANQTSAPEPWPSQIPEHVAKAVIRGVKRDRLSIFPSRIFWLVWVLGRVFPFIYKLEQNLENRRFLSWKNNQENEKR